MIGQNLSLGDVPGPQSAYALRAGVRFEPFGDGSAVLYSADRKRSVSLNHTAALVCSYADGAHPLSRVIGEVQELFPGTTVEEGPIVDCLTTLVKDGFLQWA